MGVLTDPKFVSLAVELTQGYADETLAEWGADRKLREGVTSRISESNLLRPPPPARPPGAALHHSPGP